MNNDRRKRIAKINLSELRGKIEDAKNELEAIRDEEQEARDNLPESMQEGEKGEKAQEAIDALDTIASALGDAESALDDFNGGDGL